VVDSKYRRSWGGWCPIELVGTYWVGIWGLEKVCSYTRFEVRDDSKVRFWHDLWRGDMTFHDAFPVLFGIAD
jgi:hypothetical protein